MGAIFEKTTTTKSFQQNIYTVIERITLRKFCGIIFLNTNKTMSSAFEKTSTKLFGIPIFKAENKLI